MLDQSYKNFELLILDNCSSDNTQEIIKSFVDPRIKQIRHLANIGFIANWLYGLNWAKDKFYSVLGDDDYHHSNFIESRVNIFKKYHNSWAVFSDHEISDEL